MKINEAGLNLIKSFEGLKLKAYKCPAGIWTIGYGSTGKDVVEGLQWTQAQAEERLKADIAKFEEGVSKALLLPATSNQFSAMVCFAYNVGLGNFRSSTLLRCFNKHNADGAALEFMKWTKAGGVELPGLVRRRKAESDLFKA